MRLFWLAFAFAVLFAAPALAAKQLQEYSGPVQTAPPANTKRYPVSGSVVNSVTNEPIARALVNISGAQGQLAAFTGADGRFQFAEVAEGFTSVSAQRPGFFDACSLSFSPTCGNGQQHRVGPGVNDFRLALTPASKISGRVRDSDGEPVEGLQIVITGQQIMNGRKQWNNRGSASTEDDGTYRLSEQQPGPIVVCTVSRPVAQFAGEASEVYAPRCFPNGTDFSSAQVIDLPAGQEARADFTVSTVRGFTIRGVIAGAQGQMGVNEWVEGPGGMQDHVGAFGMRPATGQFAIRGIPNGAWKFHFQTNDGQGKVSEATEEVAINGADVSGLQITLKRGIDIPVQINQGQSTAGQTAPQNGAAQVRLVSVGDPGSRQYYSSQMPGQSESGAPPPLSIQSVQPGTYKVFAQPFGNGCTGSIYYGTTDLAREPLTISADAPPQMLTVNLRNDCATLAVTVHADSRDTQGMLVVLADAPFMEPQLLGFQPNSASASVNLSPGAYHIYALSDLNGIEYANPEAMRAYPSETVTLEPHAQKSIAVELTGLNGR
ncbi:MAG: carboxypeptidase-like regulatory domain-containing protein [Acidobacteriota bacterium]|nr:carboxypeptidase-like regulatory domain-containing protein [Acidobacteriota bacterium]